VNEFKYSPLNLLRVDPKSQYCPFVIVAVRSSPICECMATDKLWFNLHCGWTHVGTRASRRVIGRTPFYCFRPLSKLAIATRARQGEAGSFREWDDIEPRGRATICIQQAKKETSIACIWHLRMKYLSRHICDNVQSLGPTQHSSPTRPTRSLLLACWRL
jgi:hypothetical protein